MKKSKPAIKKVSPSAEPSPYELARLAVALSQDSTLEKILYALKSGPVSYEWGQSSPEDFVKAALAFWINASGLLQKWRLDPESVIPPPPAAPPTKPLLPEPKRYPREIDPLDPCIVGDQLPSEPATLLEPPPKERVDHYFALWGTTPIPNPASYRYHARCFLHWYEKHHATEVSKLRRAAGAKGLASEKRRTKHPDGA